MDKIYSLNDHEIELFEPFFYKKNENFIPLNQDKGYRTKYTTLIYVNCILLLLLFSIYTYFLCKFTIKNKG